MAELAQMGRSKMKEDLITGKRDPESGHRRPEQVDKRIT